MKRTCSFCLFLIVMYSVAGVFSVSTQKSNNYYETTKDDKFVAHEKHIRQLVVRLLCSNALDDASNSAGAEGQRSSKGDELMLTSSGDLDRRVSLNGIRCRLGSPPFSSSDGDDGDDDVSDEIAMPHLRRQVDPLQSCIEAKCSGWHPPGNYQECIYRHCISTFQLGLRSLLKRNARMTSSATTSDDPRTSKEKDKEERHSTTLREEGSLEKEDEEEEEEDGEGRGRETGSSGDSSNSGMEAKRSSLRSVMRRGFNDIADVCVQHHCGSFNSHSMDFFSCVESHCAFR